MHSGRKFFTRFQNDNVQQPEGLDDIPDYVFDEPLEAKKPVEAQEPGVIQSSLVQMPKPAEELAKSSVPAEPTPESLTQTDETISQDAIQAAVSTEKLEEGETVDDEGGKLSTTHRYRYNKEQWSPLNPEGKKHYDKEFLLQFQNDYNAVQKPEGLPDIPDIILDKPQQTGRQFSREMTGGSAGQQEFIDFTPKYVWSGGGGGGGQKSRGIPRQPSNQKNKSGPPPRHIYLSISKDIELHKAKESRKPSHTDGKKETEEDDAKTEELYKKTRSILNKLTPQKFQSLVSQMQALPIDSENKLKGVIDLVFEKAISEPSSVAYANMCRCLSMFKVPSETKPGEMVNFRAVLLTRCQREFEKDKSSKAMFLTKREEIEKAEDGAKKEELKQELEYEESKAKRRSLGNIRFIGELFKLKMLTENIMHDCVFKLLRTKDPENLECLCHLLTTIGKELDVDKAKPRMDQYFQQMGKILNEKKTSSRVRFMLQDVMDLRTNKWVPRRVDNNPNTIDQIHKEVAQGAPEKALFSQLNQMQQRAQWGGRRGGPPRQMGGADDWNTVGANRTPLKSQNVDECAIQLGLGGGAGRFSGWGSTGGTTGRPSQEKEKPNTPAKRVIGASQSVDAGHRERSRESAEPEPQPSPIQPASSEHQVLSEKDMEKKTKAILDENFAVQDMKELKSTSGVDSAPTTPTTGLSMTEIELNLHELIVKNKADNETIFDWIESNVDDSTTKRAKFIRALTTAVCESAIKSKKGKERLEPKEIGARNDLLQKYLDHQADSELQALCAVQALIAKLEHPEGVLRVMFDTLYDEDIISEDAFFQWERSEEEPEGKGLCLKQAIQFFTWLREAEEDS